MKKKQQKLKCPECGKITTFTAHYVCEEVYKSPAIVDKDGHIKPDYNKSKFHVTADEHDPSYKCDSCDKCTDPEVVTV